MIFSKEEKKVLLELIGNEQIHIIIKDSNKYSSEKYKKLEELKIKIKDLSIDISNSPDCYGEYDKSSSFCTKECEYREKCK